ncbi:MAG: hypothetical protein R3Y50_05660 [Rikenellaceae bacterium]
MKKFCLHILLILSMLSSCDKIEQIKDLVDELDTRVRVLDPATGDAITGFAADGASILEIKVVFNSEELPVCVNISPEGEGFGSFSSSQELKGETDISYDLTQEDLERGCILIR